MSTCEHSLLFRSPSDLYVWPSLICCLCCYISLSHPFLDELFSLFHPSLGKGSSKLKIIWIPALWGGGSLLLEITESFGIITAEHGCLYHSVKSFSEENLWLPRDSWLTGQLMVSEKRNPTTLRNPSGFMSDRFNGIWWCHVSFVVIFTFFGIRIVTFSGGLVKNYPLLFWLCLVLGNRQSYLTFLFKCLHCL